MTLQVLALHSEGYSPTGNLAAEGFKKLLGTPSLDLLQTMVREATQNCCDAAKFGQGPEIHFRLRRLTEPQLIALRQNVFRNLPQPETSERPLQEFLEQESPWVLEICDFNTIGLAGPTRADRIPNGSKETDFIDFLRNVGSKRDTEQGGGTYGYGKSSLYLSSRCSTILVDTQTTFLNENVRRILGCHLGSAHDVSTVDGSVERRTGRHWWGVMSEGATVADPLEAGDAEALANAIGFPSRSSERRGTSIMIVDPVFLGDEGEEPETLMGMIAETLLWYFWPRMMSDTPSDKKIKVRLELDDQVFPVPSPEQFPPLDNFCAAMNGLRANGSGVLEVRGQKPKKLLGRMSIRKGVRSDRSRLVPERISIIPGTSSHIAVMRPVELVVRYFRDEPLPDPRVEWSGVFISDSDPEVEAAFASAEPPAHDDWQPSIIPEPRLRTFVNVALRQIRETAKSVAAPTNAATETGESGPSLAKVSGQLGRLLDASMGGGAGPKGAGGKKQGSTRKNRISAPIFLRLEDVSGNHVAVFETTVHQDGKSRDLVAVAKPVLVVDGGAAADGSWATSEPNVVSWSVPNGKVLSTSSRAVLGNYSGDLEVRVSIPDDCAVTVRATLEHSGGEDE